MQQEDWELAVLFFSRALLLNSELVRGRVWGGSGQSLALISPLPSHLPGPSPQDHQLPAGNCVSSLRVDSGEGTAAWVLSPSGRLLCLKSRSLHPALRLLLGHPEPAKGLLLQAREHQLPEAAHLGALPAGAWGCPRAVQGTHLTPRPAGSPSSYRAFLAPETSFHSLRASLSLCLVSPPAVLLMTSPTSRVGLPPGLGKVLQYCPIEFSAVMTVIYLTLSHLVAISHMAYC